MERQIYIGPPYLGELREVNVVTSNLAYWNRVCEPMKWTKPRFTITNLIRLRWHRDTRYYMVFLTKDLFGSWVITRAWGRRDSPIGRVKLDLCNSFAEGYKDLKAITARRKARKYEVVKNV
jgi:hypothetical protein